MDDEAGSGAVRTPREPSSWIEERAWVYEEFVEAVHELAAAIPPGRVMTYGSLAAALGSRAPRAVGRIMAHSDGLPWWRVVYADGHLLPHYWEAALERYREEGTPLLERRGEVRIDIRRARWTP
ncbi:MAG TPA: MGMT family protein [Microbacteriaceae bacterium]|nr:MGMT family protein [Microbacteriaceae bacterium]